MFNALRTDELLRGVGRVLRMAAGLQAPPDEYQRSQFLSAYSVTRLLAAEEAATPVLLATLRERLLAALDRGGVTPDGVAADTSGSTEVPGAEPTAVDAARRARPAIESARSGTELGAAVAALLAALPAETPLRRELHAALAEIVDAEITALATAAR